MNFEEMAAVPEEEQAVTAFLAKQINYNMDRISTAIITCRKDLSGMDFLSALYVVVFLKEEFIAEAMRQGIQYRVPELASKYASCIPIMDKIARNHITAILDLAEQAKRGAEDGTP